MIIVKSLHKNSGIKIKDISMLGTNEEINWEQTENGLTLTFPKHKPTDYAHVFKITQ